MSRQYDLCIGTPIAGRARPELERLVGFFVNTLVIRGRLDGNPSFRAFLAETRKTMLDAYAHQELPFEQLVELLRPDRDPSRNPLVQVMLVLQNMPIRHRQIAGITLTDTSFDHAPVANFDLTLNVVEDPDEIRLSAIYNVDLFEAATVERMLASLETLLYAGVDDPDCPVLELPLLAPGERRKLFETWNHTAVPVNENHCVHELLVQQARRTPSAVAVRYEGESLTYADLDRRSNQLARFLVAAGAGSDVPVAICLDRSPAMIIALLAILKAGAPYLPLDPLYPAARCATMLRDADVAIVVTDSSKAELLQCQSARCVLLDSDAETIAAGSCAPLPSAASSRNLAYVIYTSGSTGEPKGVEVEHRGLVNHASEIIRRCDLRPGDSVLQYLSLSFDAAGEEIFPALLSGATLHLYAVPAELSGRALLDWSRNSGVNVLHLPVPVWSSLVDEVTTNGSHLAAHLKAVVAGGDSVPADQLRRWREATSSASIFLFAYGVTEATITSTIFDGAREVPATASSCLPIGRPIANMRLYVLDEHQQPVPIGVAGELYIGGLGVARGYHRRPELSAERFLSDPFADGSNERMYRTGDLVRYLADGNLEFLGRADRQVKVRGYRIEPAEIEAALQLHPQVREAIVLPHGSGESKRLAAYVGSVPNSLPASTDLREFLTTRLPEHMLPAAIMVLPELPRFAGSKVDIASLPAPQWCRGDEQAAFTPPQSEAEQALAAVWAEVLGMDRVGA